MKTDFRGMIWNYEYDGNRNLITETDPEQNITRYEYGANDELTKIILDRVTEADIETSFTYTPYDKVETITNAMNKVTTFGYDANGHLTSLTGPDSKPMQLTYDSSERLQTISNTLANDSTNLLVTMSYDDLKNNLCM